MSWVVDTCILLDILEDDPEFGNKSAKCLKAYLQEGLFVWPVSFIEMAPAFAGNYTAQLEFFRLCGIADNIEFTRVDSEKAYHAWDRYIKAKRKRKSEAFPKRPVADIMIGAFACRFDGLITRNGKDFQPWFPGLKIIHP
jgi:predicted nucleic acid-binding protein